MFLSPPLLASIRRVSVYISLMVSAFLAIGILSLQDYVNLESLSFVLGMLALPFTFTKPQRQPSSYGYIVLACLCLLLTFAIPVKTLLFFGIGFCIFALLQAGGIKPGFLSTVTLFLMAPVFQYFANTFSFPIRLLLTNWVGRAFRFSQQHATIKGNSIYTNGNEFSVDPACMGLNMLVTSLLVAVMLIGFYQKKHGRQLRWHGVLFFMVAVVVLNGFSNLVRIFLLVQFAILPNNALHHITGLLCLALYVAVPATVLAKYMVWKWGLVPLTTTHPFHTAIIKRQGTMHIALLVLVAAASFYMRQSDTFKTFRYFANRKIPGYTLSQYAPGILKLENSGSLIYIKYLRGFYDTDHNPTLCWKGSGYTFEDVQLQASGGLELYTATLIRGKEKLYTAWCYSNGYKHTTSQTAWRINMAKTKTTYALVNITTASKQELNSEIAAILNGHSLNALFTH